MLLKSVNLNTIKCEKDEIEQKFLLLDDETDKVHYLNFFGKKLNTVNSSYALELTSRALDASRKADFPRGCADALANWGLICLGDADYPMALEHLTGALNIFRNLPDKSDEDYNRILNNLGNVYSGLEDYREAAKCYLEALHISRDIDDHRMLHSISENLSNLCSSLADPRPALGITLRACRILKDTPFYPVYVCVLSNAGYYYTLLGSCRKALRYLKKARRLVKKKELSEYRARVFGTAGDTYSCMGEYDLARKYFLKALPAARERQLSHEELAILMGLGKNYSRQNIFRRSRHYLKKALEMAYEKQLKHLKLEIHKELEILYAKNGYFKKAYIHQSLYSRLQKQSGEDQAEKRLKNVEARSRRNAGSSIKVIADMGCKITSSLEVSRVLDSIYKSVSALMDAPFFGIVIFKPEYKQLESEIFVVDGVHKPPVQINSDDKKSLIARVFREKQDIIIRDFDKEYNLYVPGVMNLGESVLKLKNVPNPGSVLSTPMILGDQVIGVLTAASYKKKAYTLTDLESLKALASYVAIALSNAYQTRQIKQKNRELAQANKKLIKDLMLARKLQYAMIPRTFPDSKMFKMYGYFSFIDEVGGDLYDVYRISRDKTAFLILDVVGHGVSSALVTAMAKMLFFNKTKELSCAGEVVKAVNKELTPITRGTFSYFSLFFGIIDSREGTLEYVNAAHPEPFLIGTEGRVKRLQSSNIFLGLKEDYEFEEKKIRPGPGDRLVLFTDGFYEAAGKDNKRYGEKRLLETLLASRTQSPEEAVRELNRRIEHFQDGRQNPMADDKTILIIDFYPGGC